MMKMEPRRNDPCTCGSGKKYKKCCMKKANVVMLHEVKEERFYQQKFVLVGKIKDFLSKKISVSKQYQLHTEFKRRTQHSLDGNAENQLFDFWLIFFHRFEHDARLIELFLKENSTRLSEEEREMALTWQSLRPKLVQAVEKNDEIITFEDMLTKEQYPVANTKENLPSFGPWFGTIGLLEHFENKFYFNGVRLFRGPDHLVHVAKKIEELQKETNLKHEDIMTDYYPEILAALITGNKPAKQEKSEITQYTLHYKVVDHNTVESFLQSESEFIMDSRTEQYTVCNWVKDWNEYSDNMISGPILMGDVIGTISIDGDQLTYITLDENSTQEFKEIVEQNLNSSAISFIELKTNTKTVPKHIEIKNTLSSMNEDTPQYLALYAKHDVRFDIEKPLPLFENQSILDLLNENRKNEIDTYFKALEYNLYIQAQQEYKNVDITPDFNTIRKEFGLPLSPFVTGEKNRVTSIKKIDSPLKEKKSVVKEEDIPFYELLGFTPATVNNFYSEDFITFFKEKTEGKSDLTLRKYRNCLFDLREIIEEHDVASWDECTEEFWNNVFLVDFANLYEPLSKTVVKDFSSTVKALAKWLVKEKKAAVSLSKVVMKVTKETEEPLLELVEGMKVK